ncbi:hypothetical protein [Mycoplasmopsis adleri]|uniref:hypothetical protein n=1 Tax=Mycoplasmopsis adleri TaxID=51362 RepID=UPI00387337AA
MAIEKWTKMYKFTNYTYQFEYFKIKPEYSFMDSTYQKASLIVVSKPNYNNERVVIYGIPSNLYKFEHITKNKYFYNMQHNVVNTVFLPISVKYKKISDKDLESYLKVDVTFWNKKPSTSYLAS